MVATLPITDPLSWPSKESWDLAWLEGEKLGQVLSNVRSDWGRRTPGYLSQLKMSFILRDKHGKYAPSQGTISNIENDMVSIMDLQPDVRRDLLKLYPLTDKQISELDERFSLGLSTQETVSTPIVSLEGVSLVALRIVGDSQGVEDKLTVLETMLDGYSAKSCLAIQTVGGTLACHKILDEYRNVSTFLFTTELSPVEGSIVLYRFRGTSRYLICIYTEASKHFPVSSFDGSMNLFVDSGDPKLEFCGVQFSGILRPRHES